MHFALQPSPKKYNKKVSRNLDLLSRCLTPLMTRREILTNYLNYPLNISYPLIITIIYLLLHPLRQNAMIPTTKERAKRQSRTMTPMKARRNRLRLQPFSNQK